MLKTALISALAALATIPLAAQIRTQPTDGLRTKVVRLVALTNATVIPEPGVRMDSATVIIRNDRIVQIGRNVTIPAGADVRDLQGAWIYAGFVDPYVDATALGGSKAGPRPRGADEDEGPNTPPAPGAVSWNQAVHPERRTAAILAIPADAAKEYATMGITAAAVASHDGIFAGQASTVLMRAGLASETVLADNVYQALSFDKGSSRTPYPSSQMGSIALVRQTLYDARWYADAHAVASRRPAIVPPEINHSLEALSASLTAKTPFVAAASDEHEIFRWEAIAGEFSLPMMYRGSGMEYRRIERFAPGKTTGDTAGIRLILPVSLPKVPDVADARTAADVPLQDLMHWYWAADNARLLDSVGVAFCFTTDGLKDRSQFLGNIRTMVARGLDSSVALAALTTKPAEWIGQKARLGRIAPGMYANLVICSNGLFGKDSRIDAVWVAGAEAKLREPAKLDVRGSWTISSSALPRKVTVKVSGTPEHPSATVRVDSATVPSTFGVDGAFLAMSLQGDSLGLPGSVRITADADSVLMSLKILLPDGTTSAALMRRDSTERPQKPVADTTKAITRRAIPNWRPFGPFGADSVAPQNTVVLKNATIWTSGPQGVLKNATVVLAGGRITSVGSAASEATGSAGATVIDCAGKHITAGLIDEHSHIAIARGVNEGTHAVTTEVRIGDVLDPDDVNIYRQLAGGVTSSHLLHGSANPMGGQLQYIKLRWGTDADGLKVAGAVPTVKFALGENVKQSNWGENYSVRYPQTRMGVEQIMQDAFQAAREYERGQKTSGSDVLPVRRDIQLDALVEILNGKRNIHCHSYVQSEILMLMRVAESFGFRVHTFTHILEGYKVAREMAKHGAQASTFSDWWAYKFEVYDAIPQNAAIMHEQGMNVSINSDDAEMARRLNQEAAKSVKYGGVSEENALKFVTINSARQMEVADRCGSIEAGKEADIVVWSGHPLSGLSRVEHTFVDGRELFSRNEDARLRKRDAELRAFLEQEAIRAVAGGGSTSSMPSPPRRLYHCDDMEETSAHHHE